jgi:hypothetical protein
MSWWFSAAALTSTGLAAISVGRDPNGFGGKIARLIERVRPHPDELPEELAATSDEGTVGSVFYAEEQELAHAGH